MTATAGNPHRGEHSFALPSAPERQIKLRFDLNALAALQAELGGKPLAEILAELQPETLVMRPAMLRAVLWAGMLRYQPSVTLTEVGAAIVDFEDIRIAIGAVLEALAGALPEVADFWHGEPSSKPNAGQDVAGGWAELIGTAVVEAGLSVAEAWALTPREFGWIEEAIVRRARRHERVAVSAAWIGVALDRHKKLPRLETILTDRLQTNPRRARASQRRGDPDVGRKLFAFLAGLAKVAPREGDEP